MVYIFTKTSRFKDIFFMPKTILLFISSLFLFSACDSNSNQNQTITKSPSPVSEKKLLSESPSKNQNILQGEIYGKNLALRCIACHGVNFEKSALDKSAILKGKTVDEIELSLKAYKAGTQNKFGMGSLMKGQVSYMTDDEIKALSIYIAKIK